LYNVNTQINYDQKCVTDATEIKFLGLIIDNTVSWKQHIEQVISKMSAAFYALRNIKHVVLLDTLKVIYFAIISYDIIFWVAPPMITRCLYYKGKLLEL
jgi:hypothetical protein